MTDTEMQRIKAICDVAGIDDIGKLSDGFHTFDSLYEQRLILFAALVKAYKDKAWKSYRHEDGEYCFGGGWFIVGIDTPEGSYTYHYENKYWDMFDCIDLPRAKHWDGHTEADAETRLMSLEPEHKPERTETNDKGFTCPENRKCMCFQCDSKGCEHWTAEIPNIPTYHMNGELVETSDKRTQTHSCDCDRKETHSCDYEELDFVQKHERIPVTLDVQTHGDVIYRRDAIDAFRPYAEYESNRSNVDWVRRIEMVLNDLPPAFPCPEGFDPAHPTEQDKKDILEAMEWVKGKIVEDVPYAEPESEERPLTEDDYAYCTECDHVEMCRWYPMYGCEFRSRPSVQPIHSKPTGEEIQKMQELEQAEIEKAYELGRQEAESEIIRCKDCLNWIPGSITDQDDFIPPKCGKYQQMVGHISDDYCSYAERKSDEETNLS